MYSHNAKRNCCHWPARAATHHYNGRSVLASEELQRKGLLEQGAKNVPHGEQVQPKAVELKQCFCFINSLIVLQNKTCRERAKEKRYSGQVTEARRRIDTA